MKKMKSLMVIFVLLFSMLGVYAPAVLAEEDGTAIFTTNVSKDRVRPGDTVEMTVSLTNYDDIPTIFVMDIYADMSADQIEYVEKSAVSIVEQPGAEFNYISGKKRLVGSYVGDASKGMDKGTTDIFKFSVKVKDSITEDAAINIPIEFEVVGDYDVIPSKFDTVPAINCKVVKPLVVEKMPTKVTYVEGQTLDLAGGQLLYTDAEDNETTVEMTDPAVTITGYNAKPTTYGKQTLTAAYKGEKTTFDVSVNQKAVEKIEVTQAPSPKPAIKGQTQTNYIAGQDFGILTDGQLKATYDNGDVVENIAITEDMISEKPDISKAGTANVTVKYSGKTTTYPVTVDEKTILGIEAVPSTLELKVDTKFDAGKVTVKTNYNNGKSDETVLTEAMLNALPDMNTVGDQTLTITLNGKTVALTVKIIDKELTGIKMTKEQYPDKVQFIEGTAFSAAGGEITLIYDNETTAVIPMEDRFCKDFDMNKIGTQNVTVNYSGFKTTYPITIVAKSATAIEITTLPKVKYIEDQDFSATGGVLKVTYDNGTTGVVNMTAEMCSGYNLLKVGDNQTVTVTYSGKTTTYAISVQAKKLESIAVSKAPQVEYLVGDKLNLKDGTLSLSYDNGKSYPLAMTDKAIAVTGFDSSKVGTQTLTVTYEEKTTTFDIKVIARDKVDALIAKIDKVDAGKLTLNDKDMVLALKAEYEALSNVEKAAVPAKTLENLNAAIAKINALMKETGTTTTEITPVKGVNPGTAVEGQVNAVTPLLVVGVSLVLLGAVVILRKKAMRQ